MNLIEQEIFNLEKEILNDFKDPILTEDLKSFIASGSKRIRSLLAILYLKMNCVSISDSIYKILASGEIIHNASLLHDDVIDDALLRRNKTTIAKKFSSKVSILAGDFLISYGLEKVLELNNLKITEIFKNCVKKMCEAELSQYFLRGKIPTEMEYIEICEGKTASLFSAILESCAIISNLDVTKAKAFGKAFGIYFQLKNDLEKESAELDKKNEICTAKEVLGIEKTDILLDNYRVEIEKFLSEMPDNVFKEELRDLFKLL